jgi:CRISPR/Cas system type I-B associated protein Csh2 (Cas7 group RAMP superfamily)
MRMNSICLKKETDKLGVNVYDDDDDEESSPMEESIEEGLAVEPVEIVREEIVTVTENPSTREYDNEDDLYKLVKEHSVQLGRLTDIVVITITNKAIRRDKVKQQQN